MSLLLPLNEEQRDCLQELSNIAMGAAAESLAELTHNFVTLPIPVIRCVDTSQFIDSFDEIEDNLPASVVSQNCLVGDVNCRAMVIVSDESIKDLADCAQRTIETEEDNHQLLKDLFNTISDTCFDRLEEMFEQPIVRQEAMIEGSHIMPELFDMRSIIGTQEIVAVEIYYHTEDHPFSCHLMLLFPDNTVKKLAGSLDRLLS